MLPGIRSSPESMFRAEYGLDIKSFSKHNIEDMRGIGCRSGKTGLVAQ
jgi:hypothetical protein